MEVKDDKFQWQSYVQFILRFVKAYIHNIIDNPKVQKFYISTFSSLNCIPNLLLI